jgi:EpsI family protein
MVIRLLITSVLLLGSAGYVAHAKVTEVVPPRSSMATLPTRVGVWEVRPAPTMSAKVIAVLGVDDYLDREYMSRTEPYVGLYVGFYKSQRQGDTMHSPLNCLPGAGWLPVKQDRTTIPVVGGDGRRQDVTVNQFVIQKGLDRLMVLYWYQSHGRVVASEYKSKMFMVYDAMRLNRTDAAMVRVITPIVGPAASDEAAAARRAKTFVQELFPSLTNVLPS